MYLLGERSSPLHCGQNPLLQGRNACALFEQLLLLTLSERKSPTGYHFSLFASQRMQAWQAFERGCLSWIEKFGMS
ncbi:hypothetical protein MICAC_4600004 [Microcystis aeruginosa PCC 9443]|uniref:Uncharacterized protein n=1 Tax=Microcystis aeruginosa PCC 9443 TaxID=1160281 RepID=I4G694_MICAE|nr:hypothetical protein MICAC_4600004 [Microcystis aeruginosa PCC 9443]